MTSFLVAALVTVWVADLQKLVEAAPVNPNVDTQAMIYLSRFGYLDPKLQNPTLGALLSPDAVRSAVIDFQAFAGLNQTGELDEETRKLMTTPRCGVKDKVGPGSSARRKRFALQGSRWRVKELTYRITKYPVGMRDTEVVNTEIARAFQVWQDVTDLTFSRKESGKVHIEIRFEVGEHDDGDPFDGQGGTLAHAYFPIYGGDAHFDDAEPWTVNTSRGTNLFQVAAHEFGHSLGLSHSDVKEALMAPFYRGYIPGFKLDDDDVLAIQSLYGKKVSKGGTATTLKPRPLPPIPNPDVSTVSNELCASGKMDAIFTLQDGTPYVFKGEKYWKLEGDSVAPGYPRSISQDWDGLPGNINAAFTWTNGKTYFFKGSKYWRFTDNKMDEGYPRDLSQGFQGVPENVDTALVWSGNGKIYFFKGDKYWRFDPSQRPPVKSNYPKSISNWEGLPNDIDAAFQYSNGYTYFFKNGQYWRFNDRLFKVDEGDPVYPRSAAKWWFGCDGTIVSDSAKGKVREDLPHANDRDADLIDAVFRQGSKRRSDDEDTEVLDLPSLQKRASSSAITNISWTITSFVLPVVLALFC